MFGRHMRATLEAAGAGVVPVSRSGLDGTLPCNIAEWPTVDELDRLFGDVQAVVHAGAIVDAAAAGSKMRMFDVNVRACASLAEWAVSRSIPLVFISSASVYADPDSGHLTEDAPLGVGQLGGFYGMTKLMAEDILGRYRRRGLKLAVVRPSSLYGFGGSASKMPYKFLALAARGETINLTTPVDDRFDFLHAADLSDAIVDILENACWETFNIASERPTSILELALACVEASGRGKVLVQEAKPSERPPLCRFFLDATAAHERLGWAPTIGIQQGLEMVLSGQLMARQTILSNKG